MSNQYAFAVAFDVLPESPSLPWSELNAAIAAADLPDLDSNRWDEFGEGRIFWGTLAECEAVKQVLQPFSLEIQEERNLEVGYYATPEAVYYVDDAGNIFTLAPANGSGSLGPVMTVTTIPLDAFKTHTVAPEVAAKLQIAAQGLAPEQITALQAQIAALEQQVQTATAEAAQRIDPAVYQALQQEVASQTAHIAELESHIQSLSAQAQDWQTQAQGKVDADLHATLQHQLREQAQHIQVVESQITDLEAQVQKWQAIATGKVEPEEYAAAQKQLAAQSHQVMALEQEVATLAQQLQAAQSSVQGQAEAITNLEQDQSAKVTQIADLEQMLSQKDQRIATLEQEFTQIKAEAETQVSRERYDAIAQDLEAQKATIATLEQQIQTLQAPAEPTSAVPPHRVNETTTSKPGLFSFFSRFWSS